MFYIIEINECTSSPCIQGSCIDEIGKYSCSCNLLFIGIICEKGTLIALPVKIFSFFFAIKYFLYLVKKGKRVFFSNSFVYCNNRCWLDRNHCNCYWVICNIEDKAVSNLFCIHLQKVDIKICTCVRFHKVEIDKRSCSDIKVIFQS